MKAELSIKSSFLKIQEYKHIVIEYVVALYFLLCCFQISVLPDVLSIYYAIQNFMYVFFVPFGLKILLDIIDSKKIPINIFILLILSVLIQIFSKTIDF